MEKKKLATYWLGGCSGCHMSLLDMDERLLEIATLADIVRSPVVDAKGVPEADIALVEGSVTSDEHLRELREIRSKVKLLVSLGDCAISTNITGLRNFFKVRELMEQSYLYAPGNDRQGELPKDDAILELQDKVYPLHEVVAVDFMIPGCPPSADVIFYVLSELLQDRTPSLDAVKKLKYG